MIATTNNNHQTPITLLAALIANSQKRNSLTFLPDLANFQTINSMNRPFQRIPLFCLTSPQATFSNQFVKCGTNYDNQPKTLSALPKTLSPVTLRDIDVICGRDKSAFNHVGNRRFRVTISIFLKRYLNTPSRLDRSILIYEILDTVHQSGGRFLKQSKSGVWVELTQKEQRNKIGHALRDAAAASNRRNH